MHQKRGVAVCREVVRRRLIETIVQLLDNSQSISEPYTVLKSCANLNQMMV